MSTIEKEKIGSGAEMQVVKVPDGSRVQMILNGKVVSWLLINDLKMRIGSALVRVGGIGGVGTLKSHRKRGYSRLCLERAVKAMREQGYDMSLLFGISDYYDKWGFASVMPEPRLTVTQDRAGERNRTKGQKVVAFNKQAHGRTVLSIYAENNRGRSTSLARPSLNKWRPFSLGSYWDIKAEAFVVTDGSGRLLGYAAYDKKDKKKQGGGFKVTEIGYRDPEVFSALTDQLARLAAKRREENLVFHLPLDHLYAEYLQRYGAVQQLTFFRSAEGMAKIIILKKTLNKCAGEFSRRLKDSALGQAAFVLGIHTDIGDVTLEARYGQVNIVDGARGAMQVTIPQNLLTQLLLGYRSVEEVTCRCGVEIPTKARVVMRTLFPRGWAYLWQADRF